MISLDFARPPKSYNQALALTAAVKLGKKFPERPLTVVITFVTSAQMSRYNQKYRGMKGPTDVLAFFYGEMGDILICPPEARKRALAEGLSFGEELIMLTVHGLLHLLGRDHADAAEEKSTFALQSSILAELGITWPPQ